uniref:Uncharacterized protein n=1 Tax=Panagrolaimus davidi TaxID=227884 RepID=A0A914R625_9BILA
MSAGDQFKEDDPTLVDLLVQESNSAVENLIVAGADLTNINLCGEHLVPRKIVPDYKEATDKPQNMRTRSRSRFRSVYHEVCEEEPDVTPKKEDIPPDANQLLPNADAPVTTPKNHNTSDEMKEAALHKSQTIEHYSPYTPRRYMGHSRWSHHYYDSYDSQFKDPVLLCSDRLYDDDDEFHFEQDELDKESILPTPTSSLDTSVSSEDGIEYSRPKEAAEKKESTSFFKNFCSLM